MRLARRLATWLAAGYVLVFAGEAARGQLTVETLADGLTNPCSVAIQPETGHVFVSDSGAGRVVRVVDGNVEVVISGFPTEPYGSGPKYNIGPLGLCFLDRDTLVVGCGGLPDGEDALSVYAVPAAGEGPLTADQAKATHALPANDSAPGEGNFYAIARSGSSLYVTCNGDDAKGWVAKGVLQNGQIAAFARYLATKEAVHVDAPVGITVSPQGEIVVGQMGEIATPNDSLLSFYSSTNELLLNLPTGLHDITALAYSPTQGQLYALDFAWSNPADGGLFRLVADRADGSLGVESKKIVELQRPTSLAFAPDGALYITLMGPTEQPAEAVGKLVRIAPGL